MQEGRVSRVGVTRGSCRGDAQGRGVHAHKVWRQRLLRPNPSGGGMSARGPERLTLSDILHGTEDTGLPGRKHRAEPREQTVISVSLLTWESLGHGEGGPSSGPSSRQAHGPGRARTPAPRRITPIGVHVPGATTLTPSRHPQRSCPIAALIPSPRAHPDLC